MPTPLLPSGCYDVLPPFAYQQTEMNACLLQVFESFGYEQVAPPLLEYTETLLSGRGAALSTQTFRVMDPAAHKVMGIRSDITMQIARIASTRLSAAQKPLRLSYAGPILRLTPEYMQEGRQLYQAGLELIGASSPRADAEVILVAAAGLAALGIHEITVDLNLPGLVGCLLATETLDNAQAEQLLKAVAVKDISSIRTMNLAYGESLISLLITAGEAEAALRAISQLDLPESAYAQCRELAEVLELLRQSGEPGWRYTIDATEQRGLNYHTGIGFSIFAAGAERELGRGGRYRIDSVGKQTLEATGFTLYTQTLRRVMPPSPAAKRAYVFDTASKQASADLRARGYITLHALNTATATEEEARRLQCGYIVKDGVVKQLVDL